MLLLWLLYSLLLTLLIFIVVVVVVVVINIILAEVIIIFLYFFPDTKRAKFTAHNNHLPLQGVLLMKDTVSALSANSANAKHL